MDTCWIVHQWLPRPPACPWLHALRSFCLQRGILHMFRLRTDCRACYPASGGRACGRRKGQEVTSVSTTPVPPPRLASFWKCRVEHVALKEYEFISSPWYLNLMQLSFQQHGVLLLMPISTIEELWTTTASDNANVSRYHSACMRLMLHTITESCCCVDSIMQRAKPCSTVDLA